MYAWDIDLSGQEMDLSELVYLTSSSAVKVVKHEDQYAIRVPVTLAAKDAAAALDRVSTYVDWLNGLGAVFCHPFEPINLGSVLHHLDEHGNRVGKATVIKAMTGHYRIKGGRATILQNGVPIADPEKDVVATAIQAATKSNVVSHVLELMSRPKPTWTELYVAYEVMDAHGGEALWSTQPALTKELKLFTWTANSYQTLGPSGRHGPSKYKAPPVPMSHQEAASLIRRAVKLWLSTLT